MEYVILEHAPRVNVGEKSYYLKQLTSFLKSAIYKIVQVITGKFTARADENKEDILFIGSDSHWYGLLEQALASKGTLNRTSYDKMNRQVRNKRYSLIVLDTMDISKEKTLRILYYLLKKQASTHIAFVSSSPTWKAVRDALRAGASDFITKEYDPERIEKLLAPFIRRPKNNGVNQNEKNKNTVS